MRRWTIGLGAVCVVLLAASVAVAEVQCTVDKDALSGQAGDVFVFSVKMDKPGDVALKVYDAEGRFVRLLTEKYTSEGDLEVPWNMKDAYRQTVKPGVYTARVKSGLSLVLDIDFADGGVLADESIISPWDVETDADGNIYLLDGGAAVLYKFRPDGTPADDLAGGNKIEAPQAPYWGSVAIGKDYGRIYLPLTYTTSHCIQVVDPNTGAVLYNVAGFFGNDPDWQTDERGGFAYPAWVGTNKGYRLYATSPGYIMLAAWDSRKAGKEGGQWITGQTPESRAGWGSPGDAGDTDGKRAIYVNWPYFTQWGGLGKVLDLGDMAQGQYSIDAYTEPATGRTHKLTQVRGVAYDGAGGLFLALRSEHAIVKFSDNGFGFDYVARFGTFGKDASKLEFTAPRNLAVSPDGNSLYVIEDGEPISEENTTPGLAHLMKFKIGYEVEKELKVTVQP